MAFYALSQLKTALAAIHAATGVFHCEQPRLDKSGSSTWASHTGAAIPYGPHGVGFLQIDPATSEVRCGACAGELDATATPKTQVIYRGRTHSVSSPSS